MQVCIFFEDEVINDIQPILIDFIEKFEEDYAEEILNFKGDVSTFNNVNSLFNLFCEKSPTFTWGVESPVGTSNL